MVKIGLNTRRRRSSCWEKSCRGNCLCCRMRQRQVRLALQNPLGTPPLREMIKADDTVAIVISDITRPTPNHKLVPWLLEEIAHVPRRNIVIINGLGSHRPNTHDELCEMLGREIVETIQVINHDAFNDDALVHVGRNSYGSEVYLTRYMSTLHLKLLSGLLSRIFLPVFWWNQRYLPGSRRYFHHSRFSQCGNDWPS